MVSAMPLMHADWRYRFGMGEIIARMCVGFKRVSMLISTHVASVVRVYSQPVRDGNSRATSPDKDLFRVGLDSLPFVVPPPILC